MQTVEVQPGFTGRLPVCDFKWMCVQGSSEAVPAQISVKEMKFHPAGQMIRHTEFISDETKVF